MSKTPPQTALAWLEPGQPFPPVEQAWGAHDPAPGLLAAGGVLDVPTLVVAYSRGIFPWFSLGQPILWWSTDPRMVLEPCAFRLHRSLRKTIQALLREERLEIRVDHGFDRVVSACAHAPRDGQNGTWIVPAMRQAYGDLHRAGKAHSVETWIDGALVGGLYCIGLGAMVYGESMFSQQSNASKIALAGLVALGRQQGVSLIDCQQETPHLASMGAVPMPRAAFLQRVKEALPHKDPVWCFDPAYWNPLLAEVGTAQ